MLNIQGIIHGIFSKNGQKLTATGLYYFLAKQSYTDFHYKSGDILLLGRKTSGVTEQITEYCRQNAVTIPMQNGMRSLNVAVSGAIVLGEALRQLAGQPES